MNPKSKSPDLWATSGSKLAQSSNDFLVKDNTSQRFQMSIPPTVPEMRDV